MSTIQVVPKGLYTSKELCLILARHRQKRVPSRTLRWWRNQVGIVPNQDGLYEEEDLRILIQLIRWIARGGTVEQFVNQLREKYNADRFNEDERA